MAIIYSAKPGGRSCSQGKDWKRQYTLEYRAITDDPYIGPLQVKMGCPVQLGNAYKLIDGLGTVREHDDGSFAGPIAVSEDPESDDGCQWVIKIDYSPYDATDYPLNPIDHPINISWSYAKFQVPAEEDINGDAILNSAGDYFFDPPVMVDESRPVLRITRNEATFDPDWADTYTDAINNDVFFGRPAKTWKVAAITSGDPIKDQDSGTADGYYYKVTYEFEYDPKGWDLKILDQGLRTLDPSTFKQVAALDEKGQQVSSPVLLDGSGQALASTDEEPYYMVYDYYKEVAYADFGLDPTGAPGQGD